MTSALFVKKRSIYKKLGIDSWDIERDACKYTGSNPVICHPPCRAWGRLKGLAKPIPGERELGPRSVAIVRKNGGVLEHPVSSNLWRECELGTSKRPDQWGGFTIKVDQSWFGHRARKPTLLYIVGIHPRDLPPYPIKLDAITHTIGSSLKKSTRSRVRKPEVNKSERDGTPVEFAKWLIAICEAISINQPL